MAVGTVRAAIAGAGNQDFTTTDLGGNTPTAAIVTVNTCVTDGTVAEVAQFCYGATDGTRQWYVTERSRDNVNPSDNASVGNTNALYTLLSNTADTVIAQGSFVSFITNGIRINHTTVDGNAYFVTVTLFSGISAYATTMAMTTLNTATVLTGVGFRATDVFVASVCRTMDGTITNGNGMTSIGFVHDAAGTVTQYAHGHIDVDGVSPTQQAGRLTTAYGAMQSATNGAVASGIEFSAFGADGLTGTPKVANANFDIGVLLLKCDNSKVLTTTLPNATGNDAVTGAGFQPIAVLEVITVYTAVNASNAATSGSITLSAVTANTQICTGWGGRDNAAISRTRSVSDNQAILVKNAADDATYYSATHVSLDADGWTRNFATVLAATRVGFALAIGSTGSFNESGFFSSFKRFGRLG